MKTALLVLSLLLIHSCAEPKGTVFLDKSLQQEEVVKFCFTADMGKDTPHQQAIADALQRENCHRIFFLGDLVYPKGIKSVDDEDAREKFIKYYEPLLQNDLNLKINLLLGNHDHKGEPSAWKKISQVNDRFFFPNYWYMLDYGGVCFVALDTSFYYYLGEVAETASQTKWIASLQSTLKQCPLKIALTHHPFKGTGYDRDDDWEGSAGPLKSFLDTFVIGVFDIHIAGHVHVAVDDGKDEGTRMLVSGAGGEVRSDSKPGYIIMNWIPDQPKKISYAIRYIDTVPTVVSEADAPQMQQAPEGPDEIVLKDRVESFWQRFLPW